MFLQYKSHRNNPFTISFIFDSHHSWISLHFCIFKGIRIWRMKVFLCELWSDSRSSCIFFEHIQVWWDFFSKDYCGKGYFLTAPRLTWLEAKARKLYTFLQFEVTYWITGTTGINSVNYQGVKVMNVIFNMSLFWLGMKLSLREWGYTRVGILI